MTPAPARGGPHILVVEARFYAHIADLLIQGAAAEFERRHATFDRISVPGAFELPAAIRFALDSGRSGLGTIYDGYLALGCVIRGETTHYDYVCAESARGLMMLSVQEGVALGYGVLTVENEAQALERARPDRKDKGGAVASACLDMIALRASLQRRAP